MRRFRFQINADFEAPFELAALFREKLQPHPLAEKIILAASSIDGGQNQKPRAAWQLRPGDRAAKFLWKRDVVRESHPRPDLLRLLHHGFS